MKILKTDRDIRFIETWMDAVKNGLTREDIFEELGFDTADHLSNRASYLRQIGVDLPRLNIAFNLRKKRIKKANNLIYKIERGL